jgi:hypothetical protein
MSVPRTPKIPPPPAAAPPQPTVEAPVLTTGGDSQRGALNTKRRGRSSLRIDLTSPRVAGGAGGTNVPVR